MHILILFQPFLDFSILSLRLRESMISQKLENQHSLPMVKHFVRLPNEEGKPTRRFMIEDLSEGEHDCAVPTSFCANFFFCFLGSLNFTFGYCVGNLRLRVASDSPWRRSSLPPHPFIPSTGSYGESGLS